MLAPLSLVFRGAFRCDSQARLVTKDLSGAKIFFLQKPPWFSLNIISTLPRLAKLREAESTEGS